MRWNTVTPLSRVKPQLLMYFLAIYIGPHVPSIEFTIGLGVVSSKLKGQCQLDLKKLQLARDETGSSVVPLTVPWGDLFLKRVF